MTYISNNLHDCYLQEKPRAEIARQVAEFEARNGRVETMPMVKRSPDTRVDLVIRADVADKETVPNASSAVAAAQKAAAHAPRWR